MVITEIFVISSSGSLIVNLFKSLPNLFKSLGSVICSTRSKKERGREREEKGGRRTEKRGWEVQRQRLGLPTLSPKAPEALVLLHSSTSLYSQTTEQWRPTFPSIGNGH
jgi:hypothetical protein